MPNRSSHSPTNILLAQAHDGDDDALDQIYGRYHQRLAALARTYLTSCFTPVVGAEDVVQSALFSFHQRFTARKFPDLVDRNSLWNLLAEIVRCKVRQAVRREQCQKRGGPAQPDDAGVGAAGQEPVSREPDPLEMLIEKDLLDLLFQRLNETNRQIAWLRLSAYTVPEIAGMLDRSQKSVERRLDTIRAELRRLEDDN